MDEVIGVKSIYSISAITIGFLQDLYYPLRWFMLLAAVLILFDLRWGIGAAKKRGEIIRFSKAGRRSINKAVDYFCWITIAGLITNLFETDINIYGIPVGQGLLLLFIFLFEINSCYSNYCEMRDIKKWDVISWVSEKTNLKIKKEEEKEM